MEKGINVKKVLWREKRFAKKENNCYSCFVNLFINHFYFMENAQQIVYSLKEKYFSTDKESRIGGRQFLTRLRAPSLILIIAFILTFGLIAQIISPS